MVKAAKKETRRQARLERRAHEEAKLRRSRQTRLLWIIAGVFAAAVLVGIVAWNSTRPGPGAASRPETPTEAQPSSGQPAQSSVAPPPVKPEIVTLKDQGRDHVAPGQPHPAYTSNPPASGWHYPTTAAWGFHTDEFPDELLIHNLEHGGIWIAYKDDQDSAVVDPLVALAREFPRKLVITHRPANDSPLAVVAWDHVMKLERFDRAAVVNFYTRFKNKGPEFVPD